MALRTIPFRPGVVTDDTAYASEGYAIDSDKIRWVQSKAQSLGGWTRATIQTAPGVPRNMMPWVTLSGAVQLMIGTASKLIVYRAPYMYNITPTRSTGTLSANPFNFTNGSNLVTVSQNGHGALLGDTVYISGSTSAAGITIGGTSGTLSAPFSTISGSRVVAVTHVAHGLASWDQVTFSGATAVATVTISGTYLVNAISADQYLIETLSTPNATTSGGGTPTYYYGKPYTITGTISANSYQIEASANANATTSGGGTPSFLFEINVGRINSTQGTGWGTGGYGTGPWGTSVPSTVVNQARTHAMDTYGETPLWNPLGGTIYDWDNDFSDRAAVSANAPAKCLYMLVTAERALMAFGCTNTAGIFDPMLIRWTDLEDRTIWTPSNTNNAGDTRLSVGSYIVAARHTRDGILAWTDVGLYYIRYTGDPDGLYSAVLVGSNCGLIGPNAAVEQDGLAYWITPQRNFYTYNGGLPRPMPCPVRQVAFADQLDLAQVWKIASSYDNAYTAVYWFFPDKETGECSRYVRIDLLEAVANPRAGWSIGTFDRTVWIDDTIYDSPLALTAGGTLYAQETGLGADGGALTRYVEWAPIDISKDGTDGNRVLNLRRSVVDYTLYSGVVNVTFYARRWPSAPVVTKGPYTVSGGTLYTDLRVQGRQVATLIQSTGATDSWRQGDVRFDIQEGPLR